MKTEIRIGDYTKNTLDYVPTYFDNVDHCVENMYRLLANMSDVRITNVDQLLLYVANTMISAKIINDKNNNVIDISPIPVFQSDNLSIVEILDDCTEICILTSLLNTVGNNYFNRLMSRIMDDYYDCLQSL